MAQTFYVGRSNTNYILVSFNLNGTTRNIFFSTVEPMTVSYSSTLTSNPLVTGDMIKDHSYKEPIKISFNGIFSLNDGVNQNFNTRLKEFENILRRVKDEGILCTITKIFQKKSRFDPYENMSLQSFSLTPHENSANFDLSFEQVFYVDAKPMVYNTADPFLPPMLPATAMSFTEEYLDLSEAMKQIEELCIKANIVEQEVVDAADVILANAKKLAIGGAVAGSVAFLATYTTAGTGLATMLGISAATGPVGWIVGAVGLALAAACIIGLGAISDAENEAELMRQGIHKRKVALFKFKEGDSIKNEATVNSYLEFKANIARQLLLFNNQIFVYKIKLETNSEVYASIHNKYFIFSFEKRSGNWYLNMRDIDGKSLADSVRINESGVFARLNAGDMFYRDKETNAEFYTLNDKETDCTRLIVYTGKLKEYEEELNKVIAAIVASISEGDI